MLVLVWQALGGERSGRGCPYKVFGGCRLQMYYLLLVLEEVKLIDAVQRGKGKAYRGRLTFGLII